MFRTFRMLSPAKESRPFLLLFPLVFLLAVFCCALDQQIDPMIPCHDSKDCIVSSNTMKNATCTNGFCMCSNGTITKHCSGAEIMHQNNRSTVAITYQSCKVNHDCTLNNTFCNTTISNCECQKNYILSTTKRLCLKKAEKIGDQCIEDKQCLTFSSNTVCQHSQCSCIAGYHYMGTACYKTIDLEKPCTRNEECAHIHGVVCTDKGVCDCPTATVINEKKTRCLPVVQQILENCTEHVQCNTTFANALCIDQRCQCQMQYHFEFEEQQCFINRKLDESCGNTYECYQMEDEKENENESENESENATEKAVKCVENVCTCAENFVREEDRCVNGGTHLMESLMLPFLATIVSIAIWTHN